MNEGVVVQGWTVFKAFIALAYCTFACAGSMSTVMPIKVALADQSATSTFFVERRSGYTFALLFAWKSDYPGIKQQRDLWQGGYQRKGISLPIHLRILKDGQVFSDETITTAGVDAGETIELSGQPRSVGVRTIKNYELAPGRYTVEISTVASVDAFSEEECYVQFATYDPKI
ncbi:DUF5625 family protein [Pseudomonas corrugata]|uniref:DUF5625 family protein n=1 Tax=Pseudomonas corrugata TaxID=47879 RepID=UPI0006D8A1F8|nr:DUF5625 family protein [Pseudomonas corrugata]